MSLGRVEQSLFFIGLPDQHRLCCVSFFLPRDPEDSQLRSNQVKTCRGLLHQCSDIIASPALESFDEIVAIMTVAFLMSGRLQAYTQRYKLKMGSAHPVVPSTLQTCLCYTLTAKLAPSWNKVGHLLVAGKDFISHTGKLNAINMELNVQEDQLCMSLGTYTVRLPLASLEDFGIAPGIVRDFYSCKEAVIHDFSIPNNWCYILPSMKKGQLVSISHMLPAGCPFLSYAELREHWRVLYGYQLPEAEEDNVVYCNVYFKLVGEKLFTYPLCCIRAQSFQFFPRVDLQGALLSFTYSLRENLQSICGLPIGMTSQACYPTTSVISANSQGFSSRTANLTTTKLSRPVLTQLPARGTAAVRTPCSTRTVARHSSGLTPPTTDHQLQMSSSAQSNVSQKPRLVPTFKRKVSTWPGGPLKPLKKPDPKLQASVVQKTSCHSPTLPTAEKPTSQTPYSLGKQSKEQPEGWFTIEPKKTKSLLQEVDVEKFARNNQLSKVNAVTLRVWLKKRGIPYQCKEKKESLISKVLFCMKEC